MDKVLDELENQQVHLQRLARRIDALKPGASDVELQVSRILHVRLEQPHAAPGDDEPPPWPDPTTIMLTRVGAQRDAVELLAETVENMGGSVRTGELRRDLNRGHERMPFAMDVKHHQTPMVVSPEVVERDYYEMIFNAQQEALLTIDNAMDGL